MASAWSEWLRRVRHDLVKRLVWPARDRQDMGGALRSGELVVRLIDSEGSDSTAEAVFSELRDQAPEPRHPALSAFYEELTKAVTAAERDELEGVLALEPAFERLVRDLARERG